MRSCLLAVFAAAVFPHPTFAESPAFQSVLRAAAAPANPLNVRIATEDGATVRRVIESDGGTLVATAANGTKFTLEIPAGAMPGRVAVTMTPIKTLVGLPEGLGIVHAVKLEPSGLQLRVPAKLTVAPAAAPRGQVPVHFSFNRAGEDMHPILPDPAGDGIVVSVAHFSGTGALTIARAETKAFRDFFNRHTTGEVSDRAGSIDYWNQLLDRWSSTSGIPRLQEKDREVLSKQVVTMWFRTATRTGGACSDVRYAIRTRLNLQYQYRALGGTELDIFYREPARLDRKEYPDLPPNVLIEDDRRNVARAFQECIEEDGKRCSETGDLDALMEDSALVGRMRRQGGWAQNEAAAAQIKAWSEMIASRMRDCGSYELSLTGEGTRTIKGVEIQEFSYSDQLTIRTTLDDDGLPESRGVSENGTHYAYARCKADVFRSCVYQPTVRHGKKLDANIEWTGSRLSSSPAQPIAWCVFATAAEMRGLGVESVMTNTTQDGQWEMRCVRVAVLPAREATLVLYLRPAADELVNIRVYPRGEIWQGWQPVGPVYLWFTHKADYAPEYGYVLDGFTARTGAGVSFEKNWQHRVADRAFEYADKVHVKLRHAK